MPSPELRQQPRKTEDKGVQRRCTPHSLTKTLAAALIAVLVVLTGSANAALLLINFDEVTSYTSDGTNTWQTFGLSGSDWEFLPVSNVTLADTAGSTAAGYKLDISSSMTGDNVILDNDGAAASAFDSPATGTLPTWFDSSSAEQRSTHHMDDDNIVTYEFSGFQSTDTVDFEFVIGRSSSGTESRPIDLGRLTRGDILNGVATNGVVHIGVANGLTGSTSYTFALRGDETPSGFVSAANAIGVTVSPIPKPASLALLGLGGLLIVGRWRRRQ